MQMHFFLNIRKHCFPSTKFVSYVKELKNITLIWHFFNVFKSFLFFIGKNFQIQKKIEVDENYTSNYNNND